jgi:CRISPR/Cas system CSM-associated protein Csm4 (group 5 of RAMP superfamily)
MDNEMFTTVFFGGESDGEIIKTDNEASGKPKIAKHQIYKFLYVHFASQTQFYFLAEELNQYEAQNKAQDWLNKNLK